MGARLRPQPPESRPEGCSGRARPLRRGGSRNQPVGLSPALQEEGRRQEGQRTTNVLSPPGTVLIFFTPAPCFCFTRTPQVSSVHCCLTGPHDTPVRQTSSSPQKRTEGCRSPVAKLPRPRPGSAKPEALSPRRRHPPTRGGPGT